MALVRHFNQRTCKWCDSALVKQGGALRCEHCDNHASQSDCDTCIKVREREG